MDQIVPVGDSQKSYDILLENGAKSELYLFDGGHEISNDLINHCRGKIEEQFLS